MLGARVNLKNHKYRRKLSALYFMTVLQSNNTDYLWKNFPLLYTRCQGWTEQMSPSISSCISIYQAGSQLRGKFGNYFCETSSIHQKPSAQTSSLLHLAVFYFCQKPQALEEGKNIPRYLSNTSECLETFYTFSSCRKKNKSNNASEPIG